jgi:hypothetical protein
MAATFVAAGPVAATFAADDPAAPGAEVAMLSTVNSRQTFVMTASLPAFAASWMYHAREILSSHAGVIESRGSLDHERSASQRDPGLEAARPAR